MLTSNIFSPFFFSTCFIFLLASCTYSQAGGESIKLNDQYQCLPCGSDCDTIAHSQPGTCSHCQMQLVKKSTITHKTIEPSAICSYIKKHPDVILLDVRTKEEFEGKADPNFGTLKNAINIPIQELESKLTSIAYLKNKEIIVFCSHSRRSPRASYILTNNGFTNVSNMAGGMSKMNDTDCKK